MFEKGFLQDVRHNLWEILPGWGRGCLFPDSPFFKTDITIPSKEKTLHPVDIVL